MNTSKPSLDTAYALVDRAMEHLAELKQLHDIVISAYAEATVIKPQRQMSVEGIGECTFIEVESGHVAAPIPEKVRILIGEVASNLRSALNYLITRLGTLDAGIVRKKAQFPIETCPNQFAGKRERFLEGINDAHVAEIERCQPYNGVEWTDHLQALRNLHRHTDLVVVVHDMIVHGTVSATEGDAGKVAMEVNFQPTLRISLCDGLPIIETLEVIKSQVTKLIDTFKPDFT